MSGLDTILAAYSFSDEIAIARHISSHELVITGTLLLPSVGYLVGMFRMMGVNRDTNRP